MTSELQPVLTWKVQFVEPNSWTLTDHQGSVLQRWSAKRMVLAALRTSWIAAGKPLVKVVVYDEAGKEETEIKLLFTEVE